MLRRLSSVVRSHFPTSSPKLLGQSKPNFMWSLLWWGKQKFVCSTWPRWPPRPYMVKTLQKSLEPVDRFHRNLVMSQLLLKELNYIFICYVASGTPAHHSLFKLWAWVDLDLFYGKNKFGNLGFSIEKLNTVDFSETIEACDLKVGRCRQLLVMKVWKVKVISWPWPKGIYICKLKLVFPK